jgi:hypothetical protein
MKKFIFIPFLILMINTLTAQDTKAVIVKFSCYPPNGCSKIFNIPDTNSIHPAWISDYKAGSNFGSNWSFVATKLITNQQGKFLYGDLYSPRGGKMNIKQNGFNGPIYVYYKEWSCSK